MMTLIFVYTLPCCNLQCMLMIGKKTCKTWKQMELSFIVGAPQLYVIVTCELYKIDSHFILFKPKCQGQIYISLVKVKVKFSTNKIGNILRHSISQIHLNSINDNCYAE